MRGLAMPRSRNTVCFPMGTSVRGPDARTSRQRWEGFCEKLRYGAMKTAGHLSTRWPLITKPYGPGAAMNTLRVAALIIGPIRWLLVLDSGVTPKRSSGECLAAGAFGLRTDLTLDIDAHKITNEVGLALLCRGLHSGAHPWKSFDSDDMKRLYPKGFCKPRRDDQSPSLSPRRGTHGAENL